MFMRNIYIQNVAKSIWHGISNSHIHKLTAEASTIDSIEDFSAFRSFVNKIKENEIAGGGSFGTNKVASESLFYGHLKAIVEYAGCEYRDSFRLIFPYIEHGVAWLQRLPANVKYPYVHCAIAQGAYRREVICSARSGIPFYTIGPYIHYAKQYYSASKLEDMKRRLGKTLLVFPAHTYELSDVEYGRERFVESVMERYSDEYDSIMVSAYWHDVNDCVFSLFEKAGAYVVSSGLREDPKFISRLKTLITLSDAVVGNALGTHIGYCHCLKTPFYMLNVEEASIKDIGNGFKPSEEQQLHELHENAKAIYKIDGDLDLQSKFYQKYWGGDGSVKTPEEIRCMIEISQAVLHYSHGECSRFMKSVESVLEEAKRGNSAEDKMRYRLLIDALG